MQAALDGMIIEKKRIDGGILMNVEGAVKLGESTAFIAETLERTLDEEEVHVLIDFSKVNDIDSTGIGEMVSFLDRFKQRGRKLALINPTERIRRRLEVSSLDELFPIHDSVEEALAKD